MTCVIVCATCVLSFLVLSRTPGALNHSRIYSPWHGRIRHHSAEEVSPPSHGTSWESKPSLYNKWNLRHGLLHDETSKEIQYLRAVRLRKSQEFLAMAVGIRNAQLAHTVYSALEYAHRGDNTCLSRWGQVFTSRKFFHSYTSEHLKVTVCNKITNYCYNYNMVLFSHYH